jgi:adenylate cyclase
MTGIHLKNIIKKGSAAATWLADFTESANKPIAVENGNGQFLFGVPNGASEKHPVKVEDEIIGWVHGGKEALLAANFLSLLSEKESEKKKLGSEVLTLYREVNLIFDFSEKLAQTIGAASIAQTTLDEIIQVIKSDQSAVVLWNDSEKRLESVASTGDPFFSETTVNVKLDILRKIIFSGQSEILNDVSSLTESGIIDKNIKSIVYAALKVNHRIMGAVILASHQPSQYVAADLKLLVTFAVHCSSAIESALLYERNIKEANERENAMRVIYNAAGKFVPYEFLGSLGHKLITDVKLGDQVQKVVTVLFSDIRDYATLSERMTPEVNFSFICAFNEKMGPIIRRHRGFINQYLGDAIMAIFPGNSADALAAAIDMQRAVTELNSNRQNKDYPEIQIGVGMHTGPLIMGITGDDARLDAATISDTVNTASRIESLTKYYKAEIIITEACMQEMNLKENFHIRSLGKVQVKGKLAPLSIYECFSGNSQDQFQRKLETLPVYNDGLSLYLTKSFPKAFLAFQTLLESNPRDLTANFFLGKAAKYISTGVPTNWVGVEEMSEK